MELSVALTLPAGCMGPPAEWDGLEETRARFKPLGAWLRLRGTDECVRPHTSIVAFAFDSTDKSAPARLFIQADP